VKAAAVPHEGGAAAVPHTSAGSDTIEVVVNGQPRGVPEGTTLLGLLGELALDARTVVVEHNRQIVRRPELGGVRLAPGDAVEIVHFVGGG
jgi:thiamine biosynthesis protein ThiS